MVLTTPIGPSSWTWKNEDSSDTLEVEYEYDRFSQIEKFKSLTFKNSQTITQIGCDSLFINDFLAKDLKRFERFKMPQNAVDVSNGKFFEIRDEGVYLRFKNLDWLKKTDSSRVKYISVHIKYIVGSETKIFKEVLPSCLKILGLKRFLYKKLQIAKHTQVPFDKCRLLKKYSLPNEYTLKGCGLKGEDNEIELIYGPSAETASSLQIKTGSVAMTTTDFEHYSSSLIEHFGVVCLIKLPNNETGTGFLCGKMIVTNAHVLSKENTKEGNFDHNYFAEFTFSSKKSIIIPLDKLLFCSASPTGINGITKKKFDFSVVSLKLDSLDSFSYYRFLRLAKVASNLFKIDRSLFGTVEAWKIRANIIQHPNGNEKKICFQENYVTDSDTFTFHYESFTDNGSSGAPAIDNLMRLIGIHRASCHVIEQHLILHIKKLFEELHFVAKEEDTYFDQFSHVPNLQVHFEGPNKGNCFYMKENGIDIRRKFSLFELIKENAYRIKRDAKDPDPNEETRQWAFKFLEKNGVILDRCHIFCNTAINIDFIFGRLNKRKNVHALNQIKDSQQFSIKEKFMSLPELSYYPFLIYYYILPPTLISGLGVGMFGIGYGAYRLFIYGTNQLLKK